MSDDVAAKTREEWVLVPRKPTVDMKYVAAGILRRWSVSHNARTPNPYALMTEVADIYAAMLDAASSPPPKAATPND